MLRSCVLRATFDGLRYLWASCNVEIPHIGPTYSSQRLLALTTLRSSHVIHLTFHLMSPFPLCFT